MTTHNCETCPAHAHLAQMGLKVERFDRVVALAGNPNTGKSTLFNALTGLKQHTGNWPGKTVTRAEGGFQFNNVRYKLVDLPGTYSLLSASHDEEIARDFLLFGTPDCTIVVADATALERNLNLVLQVLEITDKVVLAVNLMDEARRKGIEVDVRSLSRDLGVPAVPVVARTGEGLHALLTSVDGVVSGEITTKPRRAEGHGGVQRRGRGAGAADRSGGTRRAERALDCDPPARWRRPRRARAAHRRTCRSSSSGSSGRTIASAARSRCRGRSEQRKPRAAVGRSRRGQVQASSP